MQHVVCGEKVEEKARVSSKDSSSSKVRAVGEEAHGVPLTANTGFLVRVSFKFTILFIYLFIYSFIYSSERQNDNI